MTPDNLTGLRHIPVWVRISVLTIVVLLFVASAVLVLASLGNPERAAWVAPATALAETASTGFLVVLIMFFAERRRSLPRIEATTRRFFEHDLPRALRRLSLPNADFYQWQEDAQTYAQPHEAEIDIAISHAEGAVRAQYLLTWRGEKLVLGVELNVRRLGATYTIPLLPGETPKSAFDALHDTFEGARDADYHIGKYYDATPRRPALARRLGAESIATHTLHRDLTDEFILSPIQQQFVVQDLAIMTLALLGERKASKPAGATPPAQTTNDER